MSSSHRYSALSSGQRSGTMTIDTDGSSVRVDLNVDNNGRGMKHLDEYAFAASGFPLRRSLRGNTMVGAPVEERFEITNSIARWHSPADSGEQAVSASVLYLSCENNAFSVALYARLATEAGGQLDVLPRGSVQVTKLRDVQLTCAANRQLTAYAVSGVTLVPVPVLVDANWLPVAYWAVTEDIYRDDVLGADRHAAESELTILGAELAADIAKQVARRGRYDVTGPLRIINVHVYDPVRGAMGELSSVTVFGDRIAVIERDRTRTPADPGLFEVDGEGGTLVPGLHDMHAHIGVLTAMLYTTIGVTAVRDMGNDPDTLQHNIAQWDSGALPGPAVDRSGFIEGSSEFAAKTGMVVDSQEQALDAVRWYAQRGYSRIKIYNSIKPEWVPAMSAEARRLGLRTLGHVPAFTTAKRMIEAGYDEITHVNQLMLGWLLEPGEDSRTMLRLMGLVRAKGFDIDAPEVEDVVDLMRANGIGLDTTLMAMEELMRTRPGVGLPAADGYLDHLPVGYQRLRKIGVLPIPPDQADDFHDAYDVLLRIAHKLHRAGVPLWPGTDQLYSYTLQRELELYVEAGLTPAESLRTATIDAATHLGTDHLRGTIERGKKADFFLIPGNPLADITAIRDVRLVVQNGRAYSPHHMHLALGITPWVTAPGVRLGDDVVEPGTLRDAF